MRTFTLIGITVLFSSNIRVYSQVELDTSITREINAISISDINIKRLNSLDMKSVELYAWLAYAQKDYEKAAKYYLFIINNNIDDANSLYNLSCCYARLDYPDLAGYFLIKSINAGFNNFSKIQSEEAFKPVKENSYFNDAYNQAMAYGKSFGETVYVEANVFVKCKVFLPKNYSPEKEYKLLVGLHGYGGACESFSSIFRFIQSDDIIFVVPEAPYLKNTNGNKYLQYSWDFQVNDAELWRKSDPAVIDYIMNVIDYMNDRYNIQKNYILGFSQGVSYAYCAGIKNPEKINGIIAVGGILPDNSEYPWMLSEADIQQGNKVNVFIAHGKNDNAVNYKNSVEAKKELKKYDYNVDLLLFKGGHSVTPEALIEALNWLNKEK